MVDCCTIMQCSADKYMKILKTLMTLQKLTSGLGSSERPVWVLQLVGGRCS